MAAILGISEVHLGRLANGGSLPKAVSRGEWDVASTVQAYVAYMVGQAAPGGDDDGELKSEELKLLTARRRRAEANAITDEVEADHAVRSVVKVADARSMVTSFCQSLRRGLANASAKIAGRATSMTSAPEIEDLCRTELNRCFDSAKGELMESWSRDFGRIGVAAGDAGEA